MSRSTGRRRRRRRQCWLAARREFRRLLIAAADISTADMPWPIASTIVKSTRDGVERIVERVATDLVRGLEDAADRHLVGRARQRRQQVPLHLRRGRQRFGSARTSRRVGVATLDDPRHHEDGDDRVEQLWHDAVPHVEVEFQDADRTRSLDQRNHHDGRVGSRSPGLSPLVNTRPMQRSRDRERGTHGAARVDLLQTSRASSRPRRTGPPVPAGVHTSGREDPSTSAGDVRVDSSTIRATPRFDRVRLHRPPGPH